MRQRWPDEPALRGRGPSRAPRPMGDKGGGMITAQAEVKCGDVAAHYDDLDRFYREVWGEHVHHGLWSSGRETPEEATRRLIAVVAEQAALRPGDTVCDVGCGYGGTARVLAGEYGARVTALTVSRAQHAHAVSLDPAAANPTYLLRDWLENGLASESFDAVIAIESSEHMADLAAFFAEASRVLKPGGRFVVCAWLTRERPRLWEARLLLEPICREGRLRGMGSAEDYHRLARAAGLAPVAFRDVSRQVERTWSICMRRVAIGLLCEPSYRRFLLRGGSPHRIFGLTLPRLRLAYALGSMRYGILTAVKSRAEGGVEGGSSAGSPIAGGMGH
ncbi:MAG: class I SAM-dependent methyltransferase [Planctomycetaceae bacterium]|nr:class I SAM-dependent methyltransferase [Planctomycetaceae bacterium]